MRALALTLIAALAISPAYGHSTDHLQAGFAVRSIVPDDFSTVYSVVGGKRPTKLLDPIEARAAYVGLGHEAFVMVSLDLLGLFYDDVEIIRRLVHADYPHVNVIISSTHSHSSIDTLGIYGPDEFTTGLNPDYQKLVQTRAAAAAVEAIDNAVDVTMRVGRLDAPAGYNEFDRNRHPGSFDDGVTAIRFADTNGDTVGTIVNWASHPELIDPDNGNDPAIGVGNVVISSDFAHTLRNTVEAAGGGTAVFVNGPNGAVTALAMLLEQFPRRSVAKARHLGTVIGQTALDALDAGVDVTDPSLSIDSREFHLRVDNPFILAIRAGGALQRQLYLAGVAAPFGNEVRTEMVRVLLGPVDFLTVPGEMQPDLYTGGYLPEDEQANPDVPDERPIRAQMTGQFRFLVGLGQDELGYFVAANDYVWPSFYPVYGQGEDRNGVEHYQETLSLGRDTARALSQQASLLLGQAPEPDYLPHPGGFLDTNGVAMYEQVREPRGIWVDTSNSGRFEHREDAEAFTPIPAGAPTAHGYLDSQGRDIGATLTQQARGVWIDGNGDGAYSEGADPRLLFDSYAFGEDEPGF